MSRHFRIDVQVALPGEDDQKEEDCLALFHENIRELGIHFGLEVTVGEPERA